MALAPLIQAMLEPGFYPHPVDRCRLIETHISWIILTGDFAYKIKKPLNLGFLDFSSLEKRHHCCTEELRLNRRLAPTIYLDVVAIGGSEQQPLFATEPALEYAVRMRQFDPDAQLDHLLGEDQLNDAMIDALARKVAGFHRDIAHDEAPPELGQPQQVWQPMAENFQQIRQHLPAMAADPKLAQLEKWSQAQFKQQHDGLLKRRQQGFIRECHGDMHLANIAWQDGQPLIFDGIEFNPSLRWIDVISEIAFLLMDLHHYQRADLAWRFLDGWLSESGDYAGLPLLRFYIVYRAMVRAKIAAIRLAQLGHDDAARQSISQEFDDYLSLAQSFSQQQHPRLLICHGLSGSGKSFLGQQLLQQLGAVRLRSDVERKRLFGLQAGERGTQEMYGVEASRNTYQHLASLSQRLLTEGYTVLVDATFLEGIERRYFRLLAEKGGWPFYILHFSAAEKTLLQRVAARSGDASDADTVILRRQLASYQPLDDTEEAVTLLIDSEADSPLKQVLAELGNA